jgi:hypothetical protein
VREGPAPFKAAFGPTAVAFVFRYVMSLGFFNSYEYQ